MYTEKLIIQDVEAPKVSALTVTNPDHERVTEKYTFISTKQLVDSMERTGWTLEKTQFSRDKVYGKHLLTFVHPTLSVLSNGDKIKLHVLNSHNGRTAAKFYLGVFRLVCSNGLMVGQSCFKTPRIIHVGFNQQRVNETVAYIQGQAETLNGRIELLKGTELNTEQAFRFLHSVKAFINQDFDSNQLLKVRRDADKGRDAWTLFNVVQENLVNGLYKVNRLANVKQYNYATRTHETTSVMREFKARKITAIDRNITVNRQLWDLIMKEVA